MPEVKKEAIKAECEYSIRQSLINIATAVRVVREMCGDDLKEWFAEVGKQTFDEFDGMTLEQFNEYMVKEGLGWSE